MVKTGRAARRARNPKLKCCQECARKRVGMGTEESDVQLCFFVVTSITLVELHTYPRDHAVSGLHALWGGHKATPYRVQGLGFQNHKPGGSTRNPRKSIVGP